MDNDYDTTLSRVLRRRQAEWSRIQTPTSIFSLVSERICLQFQLRSFLFCIRPRGCGASQSQKWLMLLCDPLLSPLQMNSWQ